MSHADLFPETLLVARQGERIYTTSRKVAEHFGKQHKDVLRSINALLKRTADEGRRRNFAPSSYLNEQGKRQPLYLLSHDGFAFVVGGFTGQAADEWKWRFIDAFREQEAALADMQQRYLAALDIVRPSLRPAVEGAQAGLPRQATAQRLGKSVGAVTYHRTQARRFGLLAAAGGAA